MRAPRVEEPQEYHDLSRLDPWRYIHPYLTDERPEGRHIPLENCIKHEIGWDPACDKIVIPVFEYKDGQKLLPGWQMREPHPDRKGYTCSSGLHRGRLLYNGQIRAPRTVVVESPLSVVAKTHLETEGCGFVATMGNPAKGQYELLAAFDPLILFFDSDDAGWKDTTDIGKKLNERTTLLVVDHPGPEDVDELDDEIVVQLLSDAVPYDEWKSGHSIIKPRPKMGLDDLCGCLRGGR